MTTSRSPGVHDAIQVLLRQRVGGKRRRSNANNDFLLPPLFSFFHSLFGISLGSSSHEVLDRMKETPRGLRSIWIMSRMMSGWQVSQVGFPIFFFTYLFFLCQFEQTRIQYFPPFYHTLFPCIVSHWFIELIAFERYSFSSPLYFSCVMVIMQSMLEFLWASRRKGHHVSKEGAEGCSYHMHIHIPYK